MLALVTCSQAEQEVVSSLQAPPKQLNVCACEYELYVHIQLVYSNPKQQLPAN